MPVEIGAALLILSGPPAAVDAACAAASRPPYRTAEAAGPLCHAWFDLGTGLAALAEALRDPPVALPPEGLAASLDLAVHVPADGATASLTLPPSLSRTLAALALPLTLSLYPTAAA